MLFCKCLRCKAQGMQWLAKYLAIRKRNKTIRKEYSNLAQSFRLKISCNENSKIKMFLDLGMEEVPIPCLENLAKQSQSLYGHMLIGFFSWGKVNNLALLL